MYRNDIAIRSSALKSKVQESVPVSEVKESEDLPSKMLEEVESSWAEGGEEVLEESSVRGRVEKGARQGVRKAIKEFTRVSRNQLKFTLRNAVCDWLEFTTLTYPGEYPLDGRECKRHLNLFLTHLRSDYKGLKYVWFMEFQERGAPHFHIFTTCALPGKTYVSPLWFHIVNSGDKRHLEAGTQVKGLATSEEAIRYATSYANKANQKEVPKKTLFQA